MLAQVARHADELLRQAKQQLALARVQPVRFCRAQLRAIPPLVVFGDRVDGLLRQAQRLAHIAKGGARPVADDHAGEPRTAPAVLGVQVLNDFLAPLVLEVHINVRRLLALAADEALKQHAGACWVDLGNAQHKAHRRIGRRAPALAEDAPLPRKGHDVGHGQKVVLVVQLLNQRQLVLNLQLHLGRHTARIAPAAALPAQPAQVLNWRAARWHHLGRVLVAQLVQAEAAALGNARRLGNPGRLVRWSHALQVRSGIHLQAVPGLMQRRAHPRGRHHVLQRLALCAVHQHPMRRHQGQGGLRRQPLQARLPARIVQLLLQVHAQPRPPSKVPEQPAGQAQQLRVFGAAAGQRNGQQPAQVLRLHIAPMQPVGALGRGAAQVGDELAQIAIGLALGRQQNQPEQRPRIWRRAGPVQPSIQPRRGFIGRAAQRQGAARVALHVKAGADDQLQGRPLPLPLLAGLGLHMRTHHAGQAAVVGQRQGHQPQLPRAPHQLLRVAGASQEAEVRLHVQCGFGHGLVVHQYWLKTQYCAVATSTGLL